MSTLLRRHAEDYLAMRRALGFKLTTFGQTLFSFIGYLENEQATVITSDLAVAWARATPRSVREVRWARRLMIARIFARHMQVLDPATEVPADDILNHHYCRATPHLYTQEQISALCRAADRLRPRLRAHTWVTLIGLLAVSGLRTGEACRLNDADVDFIAGILRVRDSKFGKSRDVPIHETTAAALRDYAGVRDQLRVSTVTDSFFVSGRGTRLNKSDLDKTFTVLRHHAGLGTGNGRREPRLHDFRHSFATETLIDWYRDGRDVQARLPLLSTYLGHADPKSTYWYLTGTPELLGLAAERITGIIGEPDE